MPRVRRLGIPSKQRELEEMIKEQYGNMLTAADVAKFLCIKNSRVYYEMINKIKLIHHIS